LLKDGHSYVYPSAKHLDEFYNAAPLFPLDVFLQGDQLMVAANHSNEQNIPGGSTLLSINGMTTQSILSRLVQHISRDGDNLEYPKHLAYQFFPAYYSFVYGFQDSFEIIYSDDQGLPASVKIQGLTRNAMRAKKKSKTGSAISLRRLPNTSSAILTIRSFDKKIIKGDYAQKFNAEIRKAFEAINEQGIQHLAIDLRDNQGGELSNGVYLLQHFMKAPFQCVSSYYLLKNGERKKLNNKWDNDFAPRKNNHFNGEAFLFTNGGSFSCSAIVANTFKESKRGKVLGQMTGGSAYINCGGPNKVITLPNTRVVFTIPRTQYNLREDLSTIEQGVLPDIELADGYKRVTGGEDGFLIRLLELVER
jgi:C-terminal processing protease CtpA/Prc